MASKKLKASEKAAIVSKMVTRLKKRYGGKAPQSDRNVLETWIFSACLEDTTEEPAEAAYAALLDAFHDLNEIRVSLISEIERPLETLSEPAYRARRIREGLQHVFEEAFKFDLEPLRKKTQDSVTDDLKKVPFTTPFMRLYTLQAGLDSHVVPLDGHGLALMRWVGLIDKDTDADAASDELKSAVRKADVPLTTYLLRMAANEPNVLAVTLDGSGDGEEVAPDKQATKLDDLIDGKLVKAAPKKASAKKSAAKKKAAPKKKVKAAKKKAVKKTKKAATKK